MTEKQTSASAAHAQRDALNRTPDSSARITEAVVHLNIARQNLLAYPEGHILIKQSLDSALEHLRTAIPRPAGVTLGAAKETLLCGTTPLAPAVPACREIAAILYQRHIAAVTFLPGLTEDELARFIKLLTTKPQEIEARGGLEQYLAKDRLRTIVITPTDYSIFRFSEQQEIVRTRETKKGEGEPVFHAMVASLMSGISSSPEPRQAMAHHAAHDPRTLAHMVNTNRLGARVVLQGYQKTITGYFDDKDNETGTPASGTVPLAGISNFLKALDPLKREQFLTATFHLCSEGRTATTINPLLAELGRDLTMEMLLQANEQGEEMSPSLLNFVQKIMSSFKVEAEHPTGSARAVNKEALPPDAATSFKKLFQREEIEQYVAEDYARILMQLSDPPLPEVIRERQDFPLREYLPTLEEPHLCQRLARTLVAMLNDQCQPAKYREVTATLLPVADTLLTAGDFLHLAHILEKLRHHCLQTTDPERRTVADECFRKFQQPPFLTRTLAALDATLADPSRHAVTVVFLLGDAAVPGLLDFYLKKEDARQGAILLEMLANCMETAVGEARKRLDDVAPEKIRLLLELICRLGGEEAVAVLRELLDHPNRLVAKEVFAALLARRDHWAMDSLRQFLGADDWESKRGAIHLAGQCRLREFVPELVAMLEPPGLFRTNLRKNVPLIKALGQIGDPAALPALEKIVRRSFSLFPKDLRQLKKTVFESIGHYPAASLATLIAMGEKAQDKTIRVACQRVALHSLRQT